MEQRKTIGEKIENEIRRQNKSITAFANELCYTRENLYNIFKRNTIDIELLARISKLLNHNFFVDIANDYSLAMPVVEDEEELKRRKAITQFYDVVPDIIRRLGLFPDLFFGKPDDEMPYPDFYLPDLCLSFTLFETFEQRANGIFGNVIVFEKYTSPGGAVVTIATRNDNGYQFCDVLLDYKTKEGWEEAIHFALEKMHECFFPRTWGEIMNNLKQKKNIS